MHLSKTAFRYTLPALLIIATAVLVQLFLITRPLDLLLVNVLPDDAFYYFEIARHIALGKGPTFDGLTATNGFHPLWMLVLTPLYALFGAEVGAFEPIRAALALSILLNVATGFVVWRILGHVTRHPFARVFAFALFALNPFLLYQGVNGLETALSLFLLAALFWHTLKIEARHNEDIPAHRLVTIGIIGGLCVLARIDSAAYVGAILLWLSLRRASWRSVADAATAGLVAGVTVAPWLLWNLTHFGMLLTSSSGANTLVTHTLIYQDNGYGLYQSVKGMLSILHEQLGRLWLHTGAPALALMLIGAALALGLSGVSSLPRRLREMPAVYAFWFGFAVLFLANVAVRWVGRPWYFVSFGILLAVLAASVLESVRSRFPFDMWQKRAGALMLCGLLAFSFLTWWHKELTGRSPQHREMYAAALWLGDNLPSARVGVFNAGIIGYFSTVEVLNLDGLVNNDAYDAMRRKRLLAYLREAGVTHVADFPIYLTYRYRSFWGVPDIAAHLEEIATVSVGRHNRSADGLHIYRVR